MSRILAVCTWIAWVRLLQRSSGFNGAELQLLIELNIKTQISCSNVPQDLQLKRSIIASDIIRICTLTMPYTIPASAKPLFFSSSEGWARLNSELN